MNEYNINKNNFMEYDVQIPNGRIRRFLTGKKTRLGKSRIYETEFVVCDCEQYEKNIREGWKNMKKVSLKPVYEDLEVER